MKIPWTPHPKGCHCNLCRARSAAVLAATLLGGGGLGLLSALGLDRLWP